MNEDQAHAIGFGSVSCWGDAKSTELLSKYFS